MKELIFYRCNICGNLICMVNDAGVIPSCCGEEMESITPNTIDAIQEKHVPVIKQKENNVTVCVGSMPHPMTESHSIKWIILQTDKGIYTRLLMPEDEPKACFCIKGDECPIRAYEWCNLHGLWLRSVDC